MTVAELVTQWVCECLGVDTEYGELPPGTGPRAMVKASAGTQAVRRYLSGGGVYRFPYEVYLLVPTTTERGRLNGLATLGSLADRIARREAPGGEGCPAWGAHTVDVLPHLFSANGGSENLYQMTATLTYYEEG